MFVVLLQTLFKRFNERRNVFYGQIKIVMSPARLVVAIQVAISRNNDVGGGEGTAGFFFDRPFLHRTNEFFTETVKFRFPSRMILRVCGNKKVRRQFNPLIRLLMVGEGIDLRGEKGLRIWVRVSTIRRIGARHFLGVFEVAGR